MSDEVKPVETESHPEKMPQEFFTPNELREHLRNHYSISTLNAWRSKGTGPKFVRFGGNKVLYPIADVKAWQEDQKNATIINQPKPKEKANGTRKRKAAPSRARKSKPAK